MNILKKIEYSIKARGVLESIGLMASYFRWYAAKVSNRNRKYLRRLNGYQMYLNLDDPGISTTLGRGGTREKDQETVLLHELKPGMRILDIGANLGYYALMEAEAVGKEGRVYAVEPVPGNFEFLQENIRLNGFEDRVTAFPLAVSGQTGRQKIFLSKFSNLNTLYAGCSEDKQGMTGEFLEVDTVDVMTFLKDKGPVDFIRMDIEGAEVQVLAGVVRMAEAGFCKPKILFETHRSKYDPAKAERAMDKPLRELVRLGYRFKKVVSNADDGTKWKSRGYAPEQLIYTDGTMRGIYRDMAADDAIDLICYRGGVRAVLLTDRIS